MAQLSSSKRYWDTEMSTVDCVKKHTFALSVIAFLDFQKHFYEFFPFCGYADVRSYVKDVIMNLVTVHAQVGGSMCNLIL